jgi:hypothetical protein
MDKGMNGLNLYIVHDGQLARLKGHIGVNGTSTRSLIILPPLDRLTEVNAVLI